MTISTEPLREAAPAQRIPDFFIVGLPKSGTTALYEMLRPHPQIYLPDLKEPWFFAPELHDRPPPVPGGSPTTMAEYAALFSDALPDQMVGEATPLYLWSRTAAARIAEVQPGARIVAILREPASFLRSLHMQLVQTYVEPEANFAKALALEDARREGQRIPRYTYWPQTLLYSEHVRYVEQLKRYHAVFAPEQILVLIYDDFKRDNEATVQAVLRFLDADEDYPIEVRRANPTVRMRSQRLNELVHAVSVGRGPLSRAVKAGIKAVTPNEARRRLLRVTKKRLVFAAPEPPDEELMLALRRRFKDEVVGLSEFLGRDLVELWGYENLD
jgi:hypothetical protein